MTAFREIYEYVQSGNEVPDMGGLYAEAYGLYCESREDKRSVFLHQEKARADSCKLVDMFREGDLNRFGLFAYEGEEDAVKSDMEEHGYVYTGIDLFDMRGRLFAYCMIFELRKAS